MPKRIGNHKARRRTFIKEWREFRSLTQEQLAERMDTSKASISRTERGETSYTQDFLEACAGALSCEPADLVMRNPLDPAAPWSIWETLKPAQRKQAIRLLRALRDEEAA